MFSSIAKSMFRTLGQSVKSGYLIATELRFKSHHARGQGKKEKGRRCGKKNQTETGEYKKEKPKSMWENPECCIQPCKDYVPRYDDLYYKPSDKARKIYARTWSECPKIKIAPKKVCCYEKVKYPPMERRKKADCPKTACPFVTGDGKDCNNAAKNRCCVKIRLPGCCPVRDPPRCLAVRGPTNCKKICTPYPSYSECTKDPPRPLRPVECTCLYVGPLCKMLK